MANEYPHLVWVDCEMTGLDTANDVLVEIAVLVTDSELNIIGEGVAPTASLGLPLHQDTRCRAASTVSAPRGGAAREPSPFRTPGVPRPSARWVSTSQ